MPGWVDWMNRKHTEKCSVFLGAKRKMFSLLQNSDFGDSGLPFFRETRPARAPAPQWTSALCSAGAPAGSKKKGKRCQALY